MEREIQNISQEVEEKQLPEYLENIEALLPYLDKIYQQQQRLERVALPRQKLGYKKVLEGIFTLKELLQSGGEVAEETLVTIQRNWENNRTRLYQEDVETQILESIMNKYFPINSEEFGLTTGERNIGEEGEGNYEEQGISQEYLDNLLYILEALGNKEGEKLQNIDYLRGRNDPETIRKYSYIVIELLDKNAMIVESCIKGNVMYVIDNAKIQEEIEDVKAYILTKLKAELDDAEYATRYEHREGYVEAVIAQIQEIAQRGEGEEVIVDESKQEQIVEKQTTEDIVSEQESEQQLDKVKRWDDLIDFLIQNNMKPKQDADDSWEKKLGSLLNIYLYKNRINTGLSAEKKIELDQVLTLLDYEKNGENTQRWDDLILFMETYGVKPSRRSEDTREQELRSLLNRYEYESRKLGLSPDKEQELQNLLESLSMQNTQRWDNIIEYIRTHGKTPSSTSANLLEKHWGKLLGKYITRNSKLGLNEDQEIILQEELKKLNQADEQRWDNIIDFIRYNRRKPSITSKNPLEKSIGNLLASYIYISRKKDLSPEKELLLQEELSRLEK